MKALNLKLVFFNCFRFLSLFKTFMQLRMRTLWMVGILATNLVFCFSSFAIDLTVVGDNCTISTATFTGGGKVQMKINHNDITCCANTGCLFYDHNNWPAM